MQVGDACEFQENGASNDSRNPTIGWLNRFKSLLAVDKSLFWWLESLIAIIPSLP